MGDTPKNHDSRISAVKALCIVLMVVGHSGCPQIINDVFALIRMPCFFFVSGFLLKDKYLNDLKYFLKRRFKGLWWPYVKWSLVFVLLHNVFAALHLCDTFYTWRDFPQKILYAFTMLGTESLLGGYWFLKELLYASIISIVALKVVSIILPNFKYKGLLLTVLLLLAAYVQSILSFKIPTVGSKTLLAAAFYMAGYSYNKLPFSKANYWAVALLCLIVVFIVSFFFQGTMDCKSSDLLIYFLVAMIGMVGMVHLAGKITGWGQRILDYLGTKTLYILTFHFLSFKLVSLLKVWQYDLPITELSAHPVITEHNMFYWLLYSMVGVLLPILLWELNHNAGLMLKRYRGKV